MDQTLPSGRGLRINWRHGITVISAAILIATEVFGAAYAAGWAFSVLLDLSDYFRYALQAIFFFLGLLVMIAFMRSAQRVEPFIGRG